MNPDPLLNKSYIDLLEIDTFRVVKDENFDTHAQRGANNFVEHWIAHMCPEYERNKDHDIDQTGIFDSDEIRQGSCYYCKVRIPEPITALWSMLEWEDAGDILHDDSELYHITP